MPGYTKLFSRILESTIWREDDKTRILWITMLAMANKDGVVESTIPGLADRARISLDECESALIRFQQPDKYSWSREEEGRRVKVVASGWFLINHAKYRALMSREEQQEKTRVRVQRYRERQALHTVTTVTSNESNDIAEASPDTDSKEGKSKALSHFVRPTLTEVTEYCRERDNRVDPQSWMDHYDSNGFKVGRNAMKDWKACVRQWEKSSLGAGNGTSQQNQPSRTEQRIAKSRESILAGLGISPESRQSQSGVQNRAPTGGSSGVAKLLRG